MIGGHRGICVLGLVATLGLLGASVLWAGENDSSAPPSLTCAITQGAGFEAETGRPGALVLRELFEASWGRYSASADLSSAIAVVEGTDGALIDSAGVHGAYVLRRGARTDLVFDCFFRYRFLVAGASDLRLGAILRGYWGAGRSADGIFGDWAVGFEGVRTAIDYLPAALWEGDPLARAAVGWRFSPTWSVLGAVESFSDEDSTYFLRTLFDLSLAAEFARCALHADFMLKYSDFFTPTGYLDGLALRLALRLPLHGGGE